MLSATVFPAPFLVIFCFLNTVAIAYNSQAALPFGTILVIMFIWMRPRRAQSGHVASCSPLAQSRAFGI